MCKLDGTKCDTCFEVVAQTDSGMLLQFTFDERDADNDIIKTWLFATGFIESLEIRSVGTTVWTVITKEEWEIGR